VVSTHEISQYKTVLKFAVKKICQKTLDIKKPRLGLAHVAYIPAGQTAV